MRGRFAALTLLLLIAAGCQFQLAIKPIGSPKPNEVKAAAQKSVPGSWVIRPFRETRPATSLAGDESGRACESPHGVGGDGLANE